MVVVAVVLVIVVVTGMCPIGNWRFARSIDRGGSTTDGLNEIDLTIRSIDRRTARYNVFIHTQTHIRIPSAGVYFHGSREQPWSRIRNSDGNSSGSSGSSSSNR